MSIEVDLADLRWPSEHADFPALLSRVGNHAQYLLVLIDGKMATAPDDKNRLLAAVFTSEAGRDNYLQDLPGFVKTALNQKVMLTCNGHDLFTRLAAMPLDGIVFNCCGPERPIAFVAALCGQVLQQLHNESERASPSQELNTPSGEADFDALTASAYPDQEQGPIRAMNALWRAAFALDEWLFLMHPDAASNPQPFVANEAGYVCLFAFTDGDRLRGFAQENDMLDEKGNALMLGISPQNAIEWGRQELAKGGARRLHLNFGSPGWFAPLADLPRIYDYVQQHPA